MNDIQQEVERIRDLANRFYSDFKDEREWEQLLSCLLCRLPAEYFNREPRERKTVQQLLTPDLKEQAVLLWQLIGISDISDLLKHRVCGALETFLRGIGTDADDIKELKKIFDPRAINIFEGLEA